MSELIQAHDNRAIFQTKLLATVSALALATYVASTAIAQADESDRPTTWIELGGQLSRLEDGQETFAPPLMEGRPSIFEPSQKLEKPPDYGFEEFGAISIQPHHSDWVFRASVQYGRSKSAKHTVQQTNPKALTEDILGNQYVKYPVAQKFAETRAQNAEQHTVLDFTVGKDVGLGFFGSKGDTSIISAGVRFAQFQSKTNISLKSDPDWHFSTRYVSYYGGFTISNGQVFHSNLASVTAERSFHGIGPSVSWKASALLAGNVQDGAIAVDWGVNAAVLFGRQKARTHHQSTARYFHKTGRPIGTQTAAPQTIGRYPATPDHTRSRNVTVPNIGAFAGLSFKYPNAKVSVGYRADFFFGAMDGGIDARKTYDRNFYGPFASISIGLGG